MIKSAHIYLGLAALLAIPVIVPAQDNSTAIAVNEAVLRQAKAIELHTKLADAAATAQRNDVSNAAKLYQDAASLAKEIGPIEPETQQAIAGLSAMDMVLARDAQSREDYNEADTRVKLVLQWDPKNQAAIAFKAHNDQLIADNRGKQPSAEAAYTIPTDMAQKTQAATMVQDGKLFYEMGKLDEADAKLKDAVKLDPDNAGAYYYQNLVKQARYNRDIQQHSVDTQTRMEQVEKQWVLPKSTAQLPLIANPYATNNLVYTGPGRQAIVAKLDRIRLDTVNYDGLPLSEVVRQLNEQSRLRDPEHKGVNFLINPNADQSGPPIAGGNLGGLGGIPGAAAPAPAAIDPATGLPATPTAAAGGTGEKVDISTAVTVRVGLTDVRLADLLDAICMVCEHPDGHPIKYSIMDFGVVFADKGNFEAVPLFTRTFKVDPNTFYSGLESVGSSSFGSSSSSGGGGGGGGGGRGGGGGGGSSGGQNQGGAVVGVVNAFAGAGSLRNQGGSGGGGGGGGGTGQGGGSVLSGTGAGGTGTGGGGGQQNQGGLNYITTQTLANTPSTIARAFFTALGVNLDQPAGKSVFFNDKSGLLFVKATEQDLDTIDKAIQTLNQISPQVHIKARFIEVSQDDSKAFGFDWYLGQFNVGSQAVGTGGSSPSLTVPTSAANPLGAFPGNTVSSLVPASANDQLITAGLRNSGPTLGTLTGILTDPNFRVALHALEQRGGFETLGEPEITTMSGRQAQMRATQVVTVIIDFNFQQGTGGIQQNTGGATQ
jgi:tetratricopeptide (TPR) repeat protein